MGQVRYICPKCNKLHFKQDGSFSFDCSSCGTLLKRMESKREKQQNELAKAQLRQAEKGIRAHDYPHFFGRKTFLE